MVDRQHMARALELAVQGEGHVEPNPMVGCVVVRDGQVVGEGWHKAFGEPHAEVEALRAAGPRARGATLYVTLEPCCHEGKTPACTEAVLAAGVARVVVGLRDPFPDVAGRGLDRLREAGVTAEVGVLEDEVRRLCDPYLKLTEQGRPWVIAKWAMSLDGRIATRNGSSRWISGDTAREVVHRLRGRVDGILVGSGTASSDDPLLTARPPGPRTATRIVADSRAALPNDSRLVQTARETPLLVAVAEDAPEDDCRRLETAGCDVYCSDGATPADRLNSLLDELGRRRMTNVLIEGGAKLLGSLHDAGQIDEVHVFLAPLLIGGSEAPAPVAGLGIAELGDGVRLADPRWERLGDDLYVHGRVVR